MLDMQGCASRQDMLARMAATLALPKVGRGGDVTVNHVALWDPVGPSSCLA